MQSDEVPAAVVHALERLGLPYMIVGSLSVNVYAFPRSTHDADFVVQFQQHSISEIAAQLGPSFKLDPQVSFEGVTGTTRYRFSVDGTHYRVELFELTDDPHDQARFARRQRLKFENGSAWVPSAEDVVVTKLRWFKHANRSKDFDDIRNIIATLADQLDWGYIHSWCDRHETRPQLDEICATAVRPGWMPKDWNQRG